MLGVFSPYDHKTVGIYGLNQMFKFLFLFGRNYKTVYKGEFNIVMEPFYFIHKYDNQGSSHMRQLRLQIALPLAK